MTGGFEKNRLRTTETEPVQALKIIPSQIILPGTDININTD